VTRFQFVADHRNTFEVKRLCQVIGVSRSSFYAWADAAEGRAARAAADLELAERIRAVHAEHRGNRAYGAPRVTAELNDGAPAQERVNHKRVARVMAVAKIAGIRLRRRVRTTVPEPSDQLVPDLLERDFTADEPNRVYVGDITYLPCGEDRNLYLATVIDCFSRRLVGWSIADHMRTELVADALITAAATRSSLAGAIFHSDHGAQPVQLSGLRRPLRPAGRDPLDGRGRVQRGQRAGQVLQRHPQAGDPRRRGRLGHPRPGPPRGVHLDHPLQHRPPALRLRPDQPERLRGQLGPDDYAANRCVGTHRVSKIKRQGP
jgi:transposase InsO family protein